MYVIAESWNLATNLGICYLPLHIFQKLHLEYGDILTVHLYTCDTGTHIHLRPEEFAFVQLPNPKEILEKAISEYYPVISENDTLTICHQDREYRIQVTKTLPGSSIKTFHCDINVEMEEPHDMQHIVPPPSPPPTEVGEEGGGGGGGEVGETVVANEAGREAANEAGREAENEAANEAGREVENEIIAYDTSRFPGQGRALGTS